MIVHKVRNVSEALSAGLELMRDARKTVWENTRNGPVVSVIEPVATVTEFPEERVLFVPERNANPFFHLMESLWMLSGRNDLGWLTQYNKRMAEFSDDGGVTQPGAYGFRWRAHFGYDQIEAIVAELKARPDSRRAVLAMWDPWAIHTMPDGSLGFKGDLVQAGESKDVPCNTHIYFRALRDHLFMTVCCRSNDLWWGAHGANAVHFSVLMEYVAARLGLRMGSMTQISNNYHLYTGVVSLEKAEQVVQSIFAARGEGYYGRPIRIFASGTMDLFEHDLPRFMDFFDPALNPIREPHRRGGEREQDHKALNLRHPFLRDVAFPMARAWDAHRCGDYKAAMTRCLLMESCDWRQAAMEWIHRKMHRKAAANA